MNSLIIGVDSLNHSADRRNYAVDSRINSVDLRIYADINDNICECVIKRLNGGEFYIIKIPRHELSRDSVMILRFLIQMNR